MTTGPTGRSLRFPSLVAVSLVAFAGAWPATVQAIVCPADTTPNFTDSCYHEYLLYNVDQAEVDILILPSASPYALRDTEILEHSLETWDRGIDFLAPSWLADGLDLHWYSVGVDAVPPEALWDPEIVVVSGDVNPVLLFGIGLQTPTSWCHGLSSPLGLGVQDLGPISFDRMAERLAQEPTFHQHEGSAWGMLSMSCESGGQTCFVVNTNFLSTPNAGNWRDMHDLNSHEVGHCLGLGHVGDAQDFSANAYPRDDIMSYETDGHQASHILCVSTLNILALQRVYGHLLGMQGYPVFPAGSYVHQSPEAWATDGSSQCSSGGNGAGLPVDLATVVCLVQPCICTDGIDNDGDGLMDWGSGISNDPDCTSSGDSNECPASSDLDQSNPDGDSKANCLDVDDDNDLIADLFESNRPGLYDKNLADSDGDGILDIRDVFPKQGTNAVPKIEVQASTYVLKRDCEANGSDRADPYIPTGWLKIALMNQVTADLQSPVGWTDGTQKEDRGDNDLADLKLTSANTATNNIVNGVWAGLSQNVENLVHYEGGAAVEPTIVLTIGMKEVDDITADDLMDLNPDSDDSKLTTTLTYGLLGAQSESISEGSNSECSAKIGFLFSDNFDATPLRVGMYHLNNLTGLIEETTPI